MWEFDANDDGSEVFFLFTVDDTIADHGESIQVSFGTDLPPGVSVSSFGPTATVTIIDDDPAVTASFGAATYSVTEGDDGGRDGDAERRPHAPGDHSRNRHRPGRRHVHG